MSKHPIPDETLTEWRALAESAAPSSTPWEFGFVGPPDRTPEEARAWYLAMLDGRHEPGWHCVIVADHENPGEQLCMAVTGNGPTSAARAKYLAWSQPNNVRGLIDDLVLTRDERDTAMRMLSQARAEIAAMRAQNGSTAEVG